MTYARNFKDLIVWQKSHQLVLVIYKVTKNFPIHERYSLVPQIRRACVSVASNIVEGFHRKSNKESYHFYNYSEASLEEVKYQLLVSKDLEYINIEMYNEINELCDEVGKLLNGWMKKQVIK
ncbi:four helix bundle protein [Patescibacteria group bacterium]|nr:four helix bundle protein [Patescibacteria group bacterium]